MDFQSREIIRSVMEGKSLDAAIDKVVEQEGKSLPSKPKTEKKKLTLTQLLADSSKIFTAYEKNFPKLSNTVTTQSFIDAQEVIFSALDYLVAASQSLERTKLAAAFERIRDDVSDSVDKLLVGEDEYVELTESEELPPKFSYEEPTTASQFYDANNSDAFRTKLKDMADAQAPEEVASVVDVTKLDPATIASKILSDPSEIVPVDDDGEDVVEETGEVKLNRIQEGLVQGLASGKLLQDNETSSLGLGLGLGSTEVDSILDSFPDSEF